MDRFAAPARLLRLLVTIALLSGTAILTVNAEAAATLSVTPSSATTGTVVHLVVQTTNPGYQDGMVVLQVTGPEAAPATYLANNVRVNGNRVEGDLALRSTDGLPAGPGKYKVSLCRVTCVTDELSETGSLLVAAPRPAVTSVSRELLGHGDTTVAVYGRNFTAGSTPTFPNSDLTFSVASRTPTTIVGTVTAPAEARGPRTLRVLSSDGTHADCDRCVRVADYDLSSTTPVVLSNDDGAQSLTVSAPGLPDGPATLALSTADPVPGQPVITSENVATDGRWAGAIDLSAAAPGGYQVALIGRDLIGVCSCQLTVANIGPVSVRDVDPADLAAGGSLPASVRGLNFARGATVRIEPADHLTLGAVTFTHRSLLTLPLSASAQAIPGPRDVLVQNQGDPAPAICRHCLTITPAPRIDSVSPRELARGESTSVQVTGARLFAGSKFDFGPQTHAVVDEVRTDGDRQVAHLRVTIAEAAAVGPRTIRLRNSDGGTATAAEPAIVKQPTLLQTQVGQVLVIGHTPTTVRVVLRAGRSGAPIPGALVRWDLTPVGGAPGASHQQQTDASGVAVLQVSSQRHSTLRLSYGGSPDTMPTALALPVLVRPILSIDRVAPATTAPSVRISGGVAPGTGGARVELWARPPGSSRYTLVSAARTTSAGAFALRLPSARRGTYTAFVVAPSSDTLLQATSRRFTIERR